MTPATTATEPHVKWVKFDITKRIGAFLFEKLAVARKGNLFFVQVGANDGDLEDPVRASAKRHDWSGLVVEPVEELFIELAKTYEDCPLIEPVNAACSDRRGEQSFYRIKFHNGQPAFSNKGLSSLYREVIRGHFPSDADFDESVEAITVEVIPLNELLEARGIEHVDLLVIDAEGGDLQVLLGFDAKKYAPDLIMVEHYHLTEQDRLVLHEMMHALHYERVVGAMDTFFFKRDMLSNIEGDALAPFRSPVLAWTWEDNHITIA